MIAFDFDYYKPGTPREAVECYRDLSAAGRRVHYLGGGTELISMARAGSLGFDAVIDIKGIPQCIRLAMEDGQLVLGSAVTLTRIAQSGLYPLLGDAVARIADHTIQGKITLGGNLGGSILYKEAALPLMISRCTARVMTAQGMEERPFGAVFDGRLRLKPGQLLVQLAVDADDLHLPFNHVKRTKQERIDYPLITLAAVKGADGLRAAVSGAAGTPVLLPQALLNDAEIPQAARIGDILNGLEGALLDDLHGSKAYRRFVLGSILSQMYRNLEGESHDIL